ncbi:MAG TPA: RsmD family RNA methyltransferase, partial [Terracidiphilus sp.]|nr:RsmD family RNA methyltransferase [Terracidiphilus sp.]
RANLTRLAISAEATIHASSVNTFLRHPPQPSTPPFTLIFLDPPYDAAPEYASTLTLLGAAASPLLTPNALIVAEHRRNHPLEDRYATLVRTRVLEQGDAALSFYQRQPIPTA